MMSRWWIRLSIVLFPSFEHGVPFPDARGQAISVRSENTNHDAIFGLFHAPILAAIIAVFTRIFLPIHSSNARSVLSDVSTANNKSWHPISSDITEKTVQSFQSNALRAAAKNLQDHDSNSIWRTSATTSLFRALTTCLDVRSKGLGSSCAISISHLVDATSVSFPR